MRLKKGTLTNFITLFYSMIPHYSQIIWQHCMYPSHRRQRTATISVNKKMKDETREILIINHNLFPDVYLKVSIKIVVINH